jgi:hypothetical protein
MDIVSGEQGAFGGGMALMNSLIAFLRPEVLQKAVHDGTVQAHQTTKEKITYTNNSTPIGGGPKF